MDSGDLSAPSSPPLGQQPPSSPLTDSDISVGSPTDSEMAPRSDVSPTSPGQPPSPHQATMSDMSPEPAAASTGPLSLTTTPVGADSSDYLSSSENDEYFRPLRRLGSSMSTGAAGDPRGGIDGGVRSFSVLDILNHRSSRRKCAMPTRIVRPWDTDSRPRSPLDESAPRPEPRLERRRHANGLNNPLDELFKMTNKTLQDFKEEKQAESASLFSSRQSAKKKRKSRTAFTNHQIFELEKRFLYQKYLSPADRDEIALSLGLSNAQVITWFQNRRAKLKRDMEELKRDMENTRQGLPVMLPHQKLLMTSLGIPIKLDEPQDLSSKY